MRKIEDSGHKFAGTNFAGTGCNGTAKELHLLKKSRHLRVVAEFIAPLTVLPFTRASADHSSRVRRELAGAGQAIGPLDILIAGHALEHQLALDTGNAREFSRVGGLRLEDWT